MSVDAYIERSRRWRPELAEIRPILLGRGLDEQIKWGKPCYSHGGKNIAILQEMSAFLALMFFKGALLRDASGVLVAQGPNSRSAKRLEFRSVADVARLADVIAAYIDEAIAIEAAGLEVDPAPALELVSELQERLEADSALRRAFESLTPGRRREYHLYISGAKQAATRTARVDKCAPSILAGRGLRDR